MQRACLPPGENHRRRNAFALDRLISETIDVTNAVSRSNIVDEVIFVVEDAPEGGFSARALGASIFTEAADLQELYAQVRDAVRCHFAEAERPKIIRLHFVREELLAV